MARGGGTEGDIMGKGGRSTSFAGKKAAPFKKGGGRKAGSPRTAKGTKRKKG